MIQLIIKYYTLILDNQIVIHSNLVLRKEINETIKTDYFKFINLENKNLTQIITYDVPQCQGILNSIVFDWLFSF